MQGGRYAAGEQVQLLRAGGGQGLDRSLNEESAHVASSRQGRVHRGVRYDQAAVKNEVNQNPDRSLGRACFVGARPACESRPGAAPTKASCVCSFGFIRTNKKLGANEFAPTKLSRLPRTRHPHLP